MKKTKQIFAMVGVVLLAALYLGTLVLALLGQDFFPTFMAALILTITLPVVLYLFTLMQKSRKRKLEDKEKHT